MHTTIQQPDCFFVVCKVWSACRVQGRYEARVQGRYEGGGGGFPIIFPVVGAN